VNSLTTICLNNGRFEVQVTWSSSGFVWNRARVSELRTDDSGIFYFLNPDNLEFLIKVLNACGLNDRYWVFFAATTDVAFEVEVIDTWTGEMQVYVNEPGTPADAVTDTQAFDTCP
jgi:hypothetical protein